MNNISDQSNLCPICDTKNKKLLIEVDYKVIKKIVMEAPSVGSVP